MALSNKQKAFVEAYLANGFNATKAAIEAGYSEKTAYSIGSENLRKPEISEAVARRMSQMTMSADEALIRLSQHARGTMADFLDSNRSTIDLAAAARASQLHLIKKFSHHIGDKSETITLELYDAQAAQIAIIKEQHLRAGEATERVDNMKLKAYVTFSPDDWDDEPNS